MATLQSRPEIEERQALIVRYETKRGQRSFESAVVEVAGDRVRIEPPEEGADLYPGKQVDVTVLIDEVPYQFVSRVVVMQGTFSISLPGDIRLIEKRQHYRLPRGISPTYSALCNELGVDERRVRLTVIDISAGGLQFVSREEIGNGRLVHMWLPLDGYRIDCIAQVLDTRLPEPGRSNHRYHGQFTMLLRDDRERLARWVFSKQLELRRRR